MCKLCLLNNLSIVVVPVRASLLSFKVRGGGRFAVEEAFIMGSV